MASREEKLQGVNYEEYQHGTPEYGSQDIPIVPDLTPKEKARILRKIDLRLVVLVGFMYCVSLMDRTNLGNAKQAGMEDWPNGANRKHLTGPYKGKPNDDYTENNQGLSLSGTERYGIMTVVFFPTYIIFQIPSTVIVRAIGPRIHLSTITILWGGVMIVMAFVTDWKTMAGMRVLLGVLEAGFFPSCVYLLSTWYPRYEMGKRYSLFYILGCVASAFAGLMAAAIMLLHGKANLAGWKWIFLIEGIMTVVVGGIGAVLLVGFPDHWTPKWKFLTEREVRWVIDVVNRDRGDATAEPFAIGKFLRPALDWKIWVYALLFFNTTTMSYALAYFLPTILKSMGYSHIATQYMAAPPYVVAGVLMWACGYYGDKYKTRGPLIIVNMLLCIVGVCLMGYLTKEQNKIRYFGIFLVAAGANANVPVIMTYQANNIRGQWKRAFCSATLVGFGGLGGIAGSLLFMDKEKYSGFPTGIKACVICAAANIALVGILSMKLRSENKKALHGGHKIEGAEDGFLYTI